MTNSSKQTVDLEKAKKIFQDAIRIGTFSGFTARSSWDNEIGAIITGTHLTYRYILVTALLAKATNAKINPLALQAGSSLQGAYDARSLCHGVIVPLEREFLAKGLGGSNEPFLNKPARFPEVSLDNAVRSGKDKLTLETLYRVLSNIKSKQEAFKALCSAMYYVKERQSNLFGKLEKVSSSKSNHLEILEFIKKFIAKSIEGQTSPLTIGSVLALFFKEISKEFEVVVHPINQSGASSREVADIDIKKSGSLFACIEVKDKDFRESDVEHIAVKASNNHLKVITFAIGPNANYLGESLEDLAKKISNQTGVNVIFSEVFLICQHFLTLCPDCSMKSFIDTLKDYAIAARAKDEVFIYLNNLLDDKLY